jgi:hypothetical protein
VHQPDDPLVGRDDAVASIRQGGEDGHRDREDAGQGAQDVIEFLVPVADEEHADRAQAADEDVAHAGVVVPADRAEQGETVLDQRGR